MPLSSQRPASAKPRKTWGYASGGSKSRHSLTDARRFGKGVSAPSSIARKEKARRRPASAMPSTRQRKQLQQQPEFDVKHHKKPKRQLEPMYTVKYLGISRGEIGILTRKVKMPVTNARLPDKRSSAGSNLGQHRQQQYRLDPSLVTDNLKKVHKKRFGPETEVDTGTVPVPDLYDSWKVSYSKQPRLLSARRTRFGVLPKGTMLGARPRNIEPGLAGQRTKLRQRPLTAMRLRGQRNGDASKGQRPSTAPMGRRRGQIASSVTKVPSEAASKANYLPTNENDNQVKEAHTDQIEPEPSLVTKEDSEKIIVKDVDAITVSHEQILEQQLKVLELEKREEEYRNGLVEQKRQNVIDHANEMPFCVHKRIRGWKLTSPARLWGPSETRDWQRRSTKLMVVAPEVIASVAAESALASRRKESNQERKKTVRPFDPDSEARMARVKADIAASKEAGIRQRKPKVIGHSWDRAVTPGLLSEARHETSASMQEAKGGLELQDVAEADNSAPPEMEAYLQLIKSKAQRK